MEEHRAAAGPCHREWSRTFPCQAELHGVHAQGSEGLVAWRYHTAGLNKVKKAILRVADPLAEGAVQGQW